MRNLQMTAFEKSGWTAISEVYTSNIDKEIIFWTSLNKQIYNHGVWSAFWDSTCYTKKNGSDFIFINRTFSTFFINFFDFFFCWLLSQFF